MKKRIYTLVVVFALIFTSLTFAHSGRTDSSGGHRDNKNKSGLGSYHYHCGGHPAHLHKNGICPYNSPTPRVTPSSNTSTIKKAVSASKQQVEPEKPIDVIVNGSTLAESYAVQQDGRILVAIRPIFDALEVSLQWDSETQTVFGQKENHTLQLTIGSKIAKVNNETVDLDVPGQIRDGKTLVAARFIAESLGAQVSFDGSSGAVIITAKN
ncbi:MAG TPA: YHYH domain-containing protein [Epulopiscium sp.]|nr:YHYH domain-containing protein [Candidatus Epulonipiscium sp.]